MFLPNSSLCTGRQTSFLLETNTHAHFTSLYRGTHYIVHLIFNVIRFDNRHNGMTYYLKTLRLHCFTRKSNRFMNTTNTTKSPKRNGLSRTHITRHPSLKQGSICVATGLPSLHKQVTFHVAFKLRNTNS